MRQRFLGSSGIMVSELCLGAMTFTGESGWRHVGELGQKEADEFVRVALDAGVNFFDTADIYSAGESERILGKALGRRRHEAIVATKVGFRMGPGINDDGLSRTRILEGCTASLKRLGTDYIDLYQVHSYDPLVTLEETLCALNDLVREGKVRYIGCSNFTGWQLMKASAISREHGWERFVSLQALYSLVARDLEYELVPVCLDQGLGILPWSPLAGGFLTGKYRKGHPWPKGTRLTRPEDRFPFDQEKAYRVVEELDRIAQAHHGSVAQVALNFLLRKPGVTSLVIGARTREQLTDNLKAAEWELPPEEVSRLDALSEPPKIYPHWYFEVFRKDRLRRWVNDCQH
jgi:aryl-alcohol dehydrogenase-like predicted oxidoreductase